METSVRLSGTLKKLKTQKKKYFVLLGPSGEGGPKLEYYDNEKKYKQAGTKAKHPILMQSCLNISKRADVKHKYLVLLFTKEDSFGLVFDTDKEQEEWFKSMLALQKEIGILKQRYDHVWEVTVKEKGLANMRDSLSAGAYRMYLTNRNLGFLRLNQDTPDVELQLAYIRSCGHVDNFFNLEIGSAAITGAAKVWMQVEDAVIAKNMHEIVLSTMKSSSIDPDMRMPQIRDRTKSDAARSTRPVSHAASMRRQSQSIGESSTLPRNPKKHRHSAHPELNTPMNRRSTYVANHAHSQSTVPFVSEVVSRSRTNSVSSHGSQRTDPSSAQSSDVEQDTFSSGHSLSALSSGYFKGSAVSREKSRRSRKGTDKPDPADRPLVQKDITVTSTSPGSISALSPDFCDGATYMEMGSSLKSMSSRHSSASRGLENPDLTGAYMAMGSSPATSTASSAGLEEGAYFEMQRSGLDVERYAASARAQIEAMGESGYMDMHGSGTVVRSSSTTLRPDKVSSLLSDPESNCSGVDDGLPPRANSVGSKPSAMQRSSGVLDSYAYMDMSPAASGSIPSPASKATDKCLSAPHLPDHGLSSNPLLRSGRAGSPSAVQLAAEVKARRDSAKVRSNESSRSTTPRSGTPSHHLDSDLLMELDFEGRSSHDSLSDFRSRTSSGGSRDFHSSGFGGSHDIRERTGSCGSRDSMSSRFYGDAHRPRTATIGQETLRPRTSSFGPADMRPRAASHGTHYKDLSRRVKEKQAAMKRAALVEHELLSRRDGEGLGSSGKKSAFSSLKGSRSSDYGASLVLPEEEYMTLSPPQLKTPPGMGSPGNPSIMSTPPRTSIIAGTPPTSGGIAAHLHHSTPTHNPHLKHGKYVHMSPDIKSLVERGGPSHNLLPTPAGAAIISASGKRTTSFRGKDRIQGSSSESLSSSSSDVGIGVKSKHTRSGSTGSKKSTNSTGSKKSTNSSSSKTLGSTPSMDKSDYIDVSPQGNAFHSEDDSYLMFDPSQHRATGSGGSFSGLEKVLSPIRMQERSNAGRDKVVSPLRDDLNISSSFQIVSPIKEEDNDALFGPKPLTTVDKQTLERLQSLNHEYVNVDFENQKNEQKSSRSATNSNKSPEMVKNPLLEKGDTPSKSDVKSNSSIVSLDSDKSSINSGSTKETDSLGYHSAREHDYMEIDLSKVSSSSSDSVSKSSPTKTPSGVSSAEFKAIASLSNEHTLGGELLAAGRFHDYCEINFDDERAQGTSLDQNLKVDAKSPADSGSIPDPFGELAPPMSRVEGSDPPKVTDKKAKTGLTPLSIPVATSKTGASIAIKSETSKSPIKSTSNIAQTKGAVGKESSQKDKGKTRSSSPIVADPFPDLSPQAEQISPKSSQKDGDNGAKLTGAASAMLSDRAPVKVSLTPPVSAPAMMDVFNIGAKPSLGSNSQPQASENNGEKTRRVSHGDMKSRGGNSASAASFPDPSVSPGIKSTSQSSLSRLDAAPSKIQGHGSSTSLTALDNSRSRNMGTAVCGNASVAGSRASYHEQTIPTLESSLGQRQTSRTSLNSDAQTTPQAQLNYARLDLSSSTDEPGLNIVTSCQGGNSPSAISVQRSASFSVGAEDSNAPVAYAEIDFVRSEQLKKNAEPQKKANAEHAPPFDCL